MSAADSTANAGPLFPDVGVIACVPEKWGGMWLSRQQILTRLSRYFHVVWVNPPVNWRKLWFEGGVSAVGQVDDARPPAKGFAVYEQSRYLPKLYRPDFLRRFTASKRLNEARAMLTENGVKNVVLYVWQPKYAEALELVEHDVSCYHIADEYSFSSEEKPVPSAERKLIEDVDQVFIHSRALMAKKGNINPSTRFVTNGVDYAAFASEQAVPDDLAAVPNKKIGYIGRIKVQLDWQVLTRLAEDHPEWSFVFVGPMGFLGESEPVQRALFARDNVYYLGEKSIKDIPAYTRHMDVCLLSYALTNYTKYIFPLKLHECLASGRPVVGSDIETLREFEGVIRIARSAEEWDQQVSDALNEEQTADVIAGRQKVARDYDWKRLVQDIAETLCERLGPPYSDHFATACGNRAEASTEPHKL